jgi:hypothetical protein
LPQYTDLCRCPTCGEHFNSTAAFDKHPVGDYTHGRRCRTPDEMHAAGMGTTANGLWWTTDVRKRAPWNLALHRRDEIEVDPLPAKGVAP